MIDGFSVFSEPLSHLMQAVHYGLFDDSVRRRSYAQQVTSSFGHNFGESGDDLLGRFVRSVGCPSPVVAQGDAAFPRIVQLGFGDAAFRCLVVFVLSADAAVHGYQSGMLLACFLQDAVQSYLVAGNPASVQPQDVETAIIRHQFVQLVLCEPDVVLPPVRMAFALIVLHTVRGSEIRIPEPFAMPVRLGEVAAYHKVFLPESIENMPGHIPAGIVLEGSVGNGEISVLGVEHAEAVMMFGGEDDILDACILHHFRPLFRVEVDGIELVFQSEIPLFVLIVRQVSFAGNPVDVFRADGP